SGLGREFWNRFAKAQGHSGLLFDERLYFFFSSRRRHTRWPRDWSSDVCSSDLFSADALAQTSVLNLVPNGSDGGIWMSGTAPAADAAGNIFFLEGNGTFETTLNAQGFPANADCGNCFVKISTVAGLTLSDYFTPHNTLAESSADQDLGSGGAILLPDTQAGGVTKHLSVGAGKDAVIYVAD